MVTGQEVKDIVRREVINALDGRNVSLADVKNSPAEHLHL